MEEVIAYLSSFNPVTVILRVLLAALAGALVGLEREFHGRAAGMRTHMMVALGAALTAMIGLFTVHELGLSSDPLRVGAQVISGVGFLGAGTILLRGGGSRITGLTTAAGLWTAAIVGLSFGAGFYEGGLFSTALILLAELVFSKWEYRILSNTPEVNLYMEYTGKACLEEVLKLYREQNVKILNMEITRSAGSEKHNACVIFLLRLRKLRAEQLVARLNAIQGVLSVEEL